MAGAVAARNLQLVRLGLDQQACGFEVGEHRFARHKAVEAAVLLRHVSLVTASGVKMLIIGSAVALADLRSR